jgi:hypothetical protein
MKFKFIDSGIIKKELVGVTCELVLLKLWGQSSPPVHLEQQKKAKWKHGFDRAAIHGEV